MDDAGKAPDQQTPQATGQSTLSASKSPQPTPPARSLLEQAPCPHCGSTGTCTLGPRNRQCLDCARRVRTLWWHRWTGKVPGLDDEELGNWCGVCCGRGRLEGATFKILKFFPFAFALLFVAACFVVIWHFKGEQNDKISSSLLTLVGTIVGFYFGGRRPDG